MVERDNYLRRPTAILRKGVLLFILLLIAAFVILRVLHVASSMHVASVNFISSNFHRYQVHAFDGFIPENIAAKVILEENIVQVGDRFVTMPGTVRTDKFHPSEYMAIPLRGVSDHSVNDVLVPEIFVQCETNGSRRIILSAPSEGWFLAPVHISRSWCDGNVEVVGIAHSAGIHVGIGTPISVNKYYWYLSGWLGKIISGLIALVSVLALTIPIVMMRRLSLFVRLCVAAFYPSFVGWAAYILAWHVENTILRGIFISILMLCPLLAISVSNGRPLFSQQIRPARHFAAAMVCLTALCVTIYILMPLDNGFWFPAYAFFPASWSTDNLLSVMMARNLVLVGPGHPGFLGNWSISDRGIIQAGTFCAAFLLPGLGPIFLSSPINNVISNIYGCLLQGLPLPLAVVFLAFLGWSRRRILVAAVIIAASPFFIFNSFYIWPKLYGGMLLPLAILALWYGLRHANVWGLCVAIGGYAVASMNHSSNLLAAPAVLLYLIVSLLTGHHRWNEVSTLARRGWAAAVAVTLMMLLGLKSAEFFEPKSSWPILYLVTGEGQFGLSSAQVHERILDFIRHIDPVALLKNRFERLSDLVWITDGFFTRNQTWPSLRFTRAVEEFSLLPSLGPGLVLLLIAALTRPGFGQGNRTAPTSIPAHSPPHDADIQRRSGMPNVPTERRSPIRDDGDLARTMSLLWMCCAANLLVLSLLQGAKPVVHQLPYGLIEGMILGLIVANGNRRTMLSVAAALQAINALLVWYLGAWGFWHERL